MTEPTTEAGRRLLEDVLQIAPFTDARESRQIGVDEARHVILAIEQEARADLAVRIHAAVCSLAESSPTAEAFPGLVEADAVLRAIREASDDRRA